MDAQAQQQATETPQRAPLTATLRERQLAGVKLTGRQAWVMQRHAQAVERAKTLGHPSRRAWPSLQAWLHEMLDYKGCTRGDLDRWLGSGRCWTQRLLIGEVKVVTPAQRLALADWAGDTAPSLLASLPLKRYVTEVKKPGPRSRPARLTRSTQSTTAYRRKTRPQTRENVKKLSEFVLECTRRFDVGDRIAKLLDLSQRFSVSHDYTTCVLRAAVRGGYLKKGGPRGGYFVAAKAPNDAVLHVRLPTAKQHRQYPSAQKMQQERSTAAKPLKRAEAAATTRAPVAVLVSSTFADGKSATDALYKLAFRRFYACGSAQAVDEARDAIWREATASIKQALDAAQAAAEALR